MNNSDVLRKKIRKIVGLQETAKPWFTRQEIKAILKPFLSKDTVITDDYTEIGFVNVNNLFPCYLEGIWQYQSVSNTNPSHNNLQSIFDCLEVLTDCTTTAAVEELDLSKQKGLIDDLWHSYSSSKEETESKNSLLNRVPKGLLDRAKEILITQDNITISIKLQ